MEVLTHPVPFFRTQLTSKEIGSQRRRARTSDAVCSACGVLSEAILSESRRFFGFPPQRFAVSNGDHLSQHPPTIAFLACAKFQVQKAVEVGGSGFLLAALKTVSKRGLPFRDQDVPEWKHSRSTWQLGALVLGPGPLRSRLSVAPRFIFGLSTQMVDGSGPIAATGLRILMPPSFRFKSAPI